MTPTEKMRELLKEFSREKALDIVETMEAFAIELDQENIQFWKQVKSLIGNDELEEDFGWMLREKI